MENTSEQSFIKNIQVHLELSMKVTKYLKPTVELTLLGPKIS